jgi:hypothetical protein
VGKSTRLDSGRIRVPSAGKKLSSYPYPSGRVPVPELSSLARGRNWAWSEFRLGAELLDLAGGGTWGRYHVAGGWINVGGAVTASST